jgi:hypothetical protein
VHNIPTNIPLSIGSSNSLGVSGSFARSDHVHQGIHSINITGGSQLYNDITLVNSNNIVLSNVSNNITISTNATASVIPETLVTRDTSGNINASGMTLSGLTASKPVFTDSNKTLLTQNIDLSGSYFDNLLPISRGGTNSSTALNNNQVIISQSGKIVEAGIMTAGSVIIGSNTVPSPGNLISNGSLSIDYTGGNLLIDTVGGISEFLTQIISGLTISYTSGVVIIDGERITIAQGLLVLGANIINGVVYLDTDLVVKYSATNYFPPSSIPIATFTTNATNILTLTDARIFLGTSLDFATPVSIGALNASGTAHSYARSDHVHQGIHSIKTTGGTQRFNDIVFNKSSDITVIDEGSSVFSFTVSGATASNIANAIVRRDASGNISASGMSITSLSASKPVLTDASKKLVSGDVNMSNQVTGILNIANGGTNSSTALNNNRIMVSISGSIIESDSLLDGQILVGSSSGAPVVSNITSEYDTINITNGPGYIKIDANVASDIKIYGTGASNVSYLSGKVCINENFYSILPGTITPPNSANGSIYIDIDGLVKSNAAGSFPENCIPLAYYVKTAGVVIDITDIRSFINNNIVFGNTTDLQNVSVSAENAGSSNKFARADHTHFIQTGLPSTITPDNANATGSSSYVARADHVHNIPTGLPVNIGSTNASGSSSMFARSDHVHQGVHSISITGSSQQYNDIVIINGVDMVITTTGTSNFIFATNSTASNIANAIIRRDNSGNISASGINIVGLTPNKPILTDSSNNLVSSNINMSNQVTGVLGITNGGTNNNVALWGNRIMVSSTTKIQEAVQLNNGQILIGAGTDPPMAGNLSSSDNSINIVNGPGTIDIKVGSIFATGATAMNYPETVVKRDISGQLYATGITLDGLTPNYPVITDASKNLISGLVNVNNRVTGVMNVANGGTNNSSLVGSRLMISTTNSIIEADKLLNGQIFIGDSSGPPVRANIISTDGSLTITNGPGIIDIEVLEAKVEGATAINMPNTIPRRTPEGNINVSGINISGLTPSYSILTDASSNLISGQINLSTHVTGVLPINKGGTNSSTSLNNNRIMISNSGQIVESGALLNGQVLIGSSTGMPLPANIISSDSTILITNSANSIDLKANLFISGGTRTIIVDPINGDDAKGEIDGYPFATPEAACAAAVAGVIIRVVPGIYNIANNTGMTVPEGVSIIGQCLPNWIGTLGTTINARTAQGCVIFLGANTSPAFGSVVNLSSDSYMQDILVLSAYTGANQTSGVNLSTNASMRNVVIKLSNTTSSANVIGVNVASGYRPALHPMDNIHIDNCYIVVNGFTAVGVQQFGESLINIKNSYIYASGTSTGYGWWGWANNTLSTITSSYLYGSTQDLRQTSAYTATLQGTRLGNNISSSNFNASTGTRTLSFGIIGQSTTNSSTLLYLYPGSTLAANLSVNRIDIPISSTCIVRNLYVSARAFTAGSLVVTIRNNSTATTMTVGISAATSVSNLTNVLSFTQSQMLNVIITPSSGTTTFADLIISFELY